VSGPGAPWLVIAATMSLVAALLHVATIVGGPDWWRPDLSATFKFWSSLAVLAMAATFSIGTWLNWAQLAIDKGK
jgi:hypothetical protein